MDGGPPLGEGSLRTCCTISNSLHNDQSSRCHLRGACSAADPAAPVPVPVLLLAGQWERRRCLLSSSGLLCMGRKVDSPQSIRPSRRRAVGRPRLPQRFPQPRGLYLPSVLTALRCTVRAGPGPQQSKTTIYTIYLDRSPHLSFDFTSSLFWSSFFFFVPAARLQHYTTHSRALRRIETL